MNGSVFALVVLALPDIMNFENIDSIIPDPWPLLDHLKPPFELLIEGVGTGINLLRP